MQIEIQSPQLECHTISSGTLPDQTLLDNIFRLSDRVFSEDKELHTRPTGRISDWKSNLGLPHSAVFYVSRSTDASEPLGFFFAIPRIQPEIGKELLHLWIAAVDPAGRGLGIFPMLMSRFKQHARECGYDEATVCTYPDVFEKMYRILNQHGWTVVAWPKTEASSDSKVLMKTSL